MHHPWKSESLICDFTFTRLLKSQCKRNRFQSHHGSHSPSSATLRFLFARNRLRSFRMFVQGNCTKRQPSCSSLPFKLRAKLTDCAPGCKRTTKHPFCAKCFDHANSWCSTLSLFARTTASLESQSIEGDRCIMYFSIQSFALNNRSDRVKIL